MRKRRRHGAAFKAKVALEAARNNQTINAIAAKYQLQPAQVSQWKGELLDGINLIFESSNKTRKNQSDQEREVAELHQKIGQLAVENDWLKKKLLL